MDATRARRLRVLALAGPWIVIPILIGSVQIIRGEWVDAGVFAVAAALLLVDALGVAIPTPSMGRVRRGAFVAVGGAAGIALVIAPRHGVAAGVVLAAVGILALAVAWSGTTWPPRPRRSDRRMLVRSAIAWAAVTVVLCLWELQSFLLGRVDVPSKSAHPAVSDLLDPVVDTLPGRILFVAAWLALGALLVTRRRRA